MGWSEVGVKPFDLPKLERERGNKFGTLRPILRSGLGPWKTRCIDHPTPMTLSIRLCLFTMKRSIMLKSSDQMIKIINEL